MPLDVVLRDGDGAVLDRLAKSHDGHLVRGSTSGLEPW
jgi:hypothetical protein